jgi:hypothetical protein
MPAIGDVLTGLPLAALEPLQPLDRLEAFLPGQRTSSFDVRWQSGPSAARRLRQRPRAGLDTGRQPVVGDPDLISAIASRSLVIV